MKNLLSLIPILVVATACCPAKPRVDERREPDARGAGYYYSYSDGHLYHSQPGLVPPREGVAYGGYPQPQPGAAPQAQPGAATPLQQPAPAWPVIVYPQTVYLPPRAGDDDMRDRDGAPGRPLRTQPRLSAQPVPDYPRTIHAPQRAGDDDEERDRDGRDDREARDDRDGREGRDDRDGRDANDERDRQMHGKAPEEQSTRIYVPRASAQPPAAEDGTSARDPIHQARPEAEHPREVELSAPELHQPRPQDHERPAADDFRSPTEPLRREAASPQRESERQRFMAERPERPFETRPRAAEQPRAAEPAATTQAKPSGESHKSTDERRKPNEQH